MEVIFFTGVDDKIAFACRLLRKKYREGARVAVYGPPAVLSQVGQTLWSEPALDFIPHLRLRAGVEAPADAARTALWLLDAPDASLQCDTALNLGWDEVERLTVHAKVAELVSLETEDRQSGLVRWKRHRELGHAVTHHPQDAPRT